MNILHLHTELNLACGISKTIYLIAGYPSEEHNHFVLALEGDAKKKFTDSKINVGFINGNRKSITGILGIVKFLKSYIKKNNIDILHSHHRFFDFVSYLVSFSVKIKRVTSVQSIVYGKKLISYKSPVLLAAGKTVKTHLVNYFGIGKERIEIFYNFVDIKEVPENIDSNTLKNDLNIPLDTYVIGYVGRFSIKDKGIDILMDSFRKFSEKHTGSVLVMVGSGDDIKKINIPENVKIIFSKENIFDYYKIFNCLILPSRVDPFPLTVLEAGMMNVPFIGANVDGISEMIENNVDGLLFEKENTEMLLEKMEFFYGDKEFSKKCSDKLYDKVVNKYNREKALDLLNNIYEKL